jgi:hypothetical protein
MSLTKVYFQGAPSLTLASGESRTLNQDGELVESLEPTVDSQWSLKKSAALQSPTNAGKGQTDSARLKEKPEGSTWPWVLGGLGLVAAAGGAATYWYWPSPTAEEEPPPSIDPTRPGLPSLTDKKTTR